MNMLNSKYKKEILRNLQNFLSCSFDFDLDLDRDFNLIFFIYSFSGDKFYSFDNSFFYDSYKKIKLLY